MLRALSRVPRGVSVESAREIGQSMMWCSDFSHHITDWPNSHHLINTMAQGVDEKKRRQIFCENAGRLYGFLD